jgi:hypothetical protein
MLAPPIAQRQNCKSCLDGFGQAKSGMVSFVILWFVGVRAFSWLLLLNCQENLCRQHDRSGFESGYFPTGDGVTVAGIRRDGTTFHHGWPATDNHQRRPSYGARILGSI